MATKPKDDLPDSQRPHIPDIGSLFSAADADMLIRKTELSLVDGLTSEIVALNLTNVTKARLLQAMVDFVPHPKNYFDRLTTARSGLQQALVALHPGEDWTGWTDWPQSHIKQQDSFEGCLEAASPLASALSALRWLDSALEQPLGDLENEGLRRQGRRSIQSRDDFLFGLSRVYQDSFGVKYTHKIGWRTPYYKFALNADRHVVNSLKLSAPQYLPYAQYSKLINHSEGYDLTFDDMHEILRKPQKQSR